MKRLLLLLAIVGLLALIAKRQSEMKAQWAGLTEAEARAKLESRLPSQIPDDKREMATEAIITKMRDKGVIVADEAGEITLDLRDDDEAELEDVASAT